MQPCPPSRLPSVLLTQRRVDLPAAEHFPSLVPLVVVVAISDVINTASPPAFLLTFPTSPESHHNPSHEVDFPSISTTIPSIFVF